MTIRFVIVQHSAAGYKGDETFAKGLELRRVDESEQARVRAAGGLVFDTWKEADDYCTGHPYPPGYEGLVPLAPGMFSAVEIDGLRVYVPPASTENMREDNDNG